MHDQEELSSPWGWRWPIGEVHGEDSPWSGGFELGKNNLEWPSVHLTRSTHSALQNSLLLQEGQRGKSMLHFGSIHMAQLLV